MPIGALVKLADSGQIQVVDDEGKVFNPGNCPHGPVQSSSDIKNCTPLLISLSVKGHSHQDLLSFLSNVMLM